MTPEGFEPYTGVAGSFPDLLGPLFARRREGRIRFGFRAEPRHSNGRTVHGGLLLGLADQVLGLTLREMLRESSATVSLTCDFIKSAMPGDWIEGEAEVTRATATLVFVRGKLEVGGDMLLTASGIWKRLGIPVG